MNDLIEALQIFATYCGNIDNPTYCDSNELRIMEVNPEDVSKKDIKRLQQLGFIIDEGDGCFYSHRFGNA
jgi:hypothetical protein